MKKTNGKLAELLIESLVDMDRKLSGGTALSCLSACSQEKISCLPLIHKSRSCKFTFFLQTLLCRAINLKCILSFWHVFWRGEAHNSQKRKASHTRVHPTSAFLLLTCTCPKVKAARFAVFRFTLIKTSCLPLNLDKMPLPRLTLKKKNTIP